jgi:glycosyltransferase involved in cell wall biosynthesis
MIGQMMSKVSVITPTYNRADMIGDAIQSVLAQTFDDWELIVVDDGSQDNTRAVVTEYKDPRIRYIYQENRGLPGARNTGIRHAHGVYVAFLDSDDRFLPNKIDHQSAELDARPELGLVAGGHREVDVTLQLLRQVCPWEYTPHLDVLTWLFQCPLIVNSILVRREWLERVGMFDESMRFVEDWDLWLRLAYAGCSMAWQPELVCDYRIHGSNMARQAALMRDGMIRMLDKLYSRFDLPLDIAAQRDSAYANVYLNTAARYYAIGEFDEATAALENAARLNPILLKGDPPRFLDTLASFAQSSMCGDPISFVDGVADHLPKRDGFPRWSRWQARGLFHAVAAFDQFQSRAYARVMREVVLAVSTDPTWLWNRGLWSIFGRSFVAELNRQRKT